MHPFSECPNWEYKDDPHHAQILRTEAAGVLREIYDEALPIAMVLDTRPLHLKLFSRLVPPGMAYLAGHYRGEDFKCLKHRPVGIAANPRVGSPPSAVNLHLREFRKHTRATLKGLDALMALPDAHTSPKEKLKYLVAGACSIFSDFLLIHPYANGNGHIARIMLTWILARFGYWLNEFPIEPRPNEPEYSESILRYQNGEVDPLERLVLLSIIAGSSR